MMTAMARLPCNNKQVLPSQQQHHHQHQQQPRYAVVSASANNAGPGSASLHHPTYAQSRSYWEAQQQLGQQQQQLQQQQQQHNSLPSFTRSHHRHHSDTVGKRKSAVELLQESKAFYVKSETVLDRKQELKNSGHLQVSQLTAPGAPPRLLRKCNPGLIQIQPNNQQQLQQQQQPQIVSPPCCWATSHESDRPLPPKSPRLVPVPHRRTGSVGNGPDQLQTKLRRLLNCTDSKENIFFPDVVNGEVIPAPPVEYATPSPVLSNGAGGPVRYSPGGSLSPGFRDDDRRWSSTMGSEVRYKFGRSNSHSHGVRMTALGSRGDVSRSPGVHGGGSNNGSVGSVHEAITAAPGGYCHKSLPDLHASTARRRASLSPRASTKSSSTRKGGFSSTPGCPDCETGSDYSDKSFNRDNLGYRSSRHIRRSVGSGGGGGDASSVLSSGGRTQKSSGSSKLSHGANARDSGGSSGHCTHRSEPPPKIQDCWSHVQRRDSGASTQHSTDRGCVGDRSRRGSSSANYNTSGVGVGVLCTATAGAGAAAGVVVGRHYSPNNDNDTDTSNSQTGEDYSPTRHSRFSDGWKESRNRPILRSKSDVSDRYWRHSDGSTMTTPRSGSKHSTNPRAPRSMTQLESFFDRMGLDADSYQHITEPSSRDSSPVFFDSVSSVDSALGIYSNWANSCSQNQWQLNGGAANNNQEESLVPGAQRSGDPPGIVEKNARIIKWLCQCRKMQFGYS